MTTNTAKRARVAGLRLLAVAALASACEAKVDSTEKTSIGPEPTASTAVPSATTSGTASATVTGTASASPIGSGTGGGPALDGGSPASGGAGDGDAGAPWVEDVVPMLDDAGAQIRCEPPLWGGQFETETCGPGGYCRYVMIGGACWIYGGSDPRTWSSNAGFCYQRPQSCPAACTEASRVCACDGNVYCNECVAKQAGADKWRQAEGCAESYVRRFGVEP